LVNYQILILGEIKLTSQVLRATYMSDPSIKTQFDRRITGVGISPTLII